MRSTPVGLILMFGMVGLTAACGTGATPNPTSNVPTPVQVTLSEFKVEASMRNFQKGVLYRFTVTNKGNVPHEYVIQPKGAPQDMSNMPGHTMTGDNMAGTIAAIKDSDLPPGATKTIDVTFTDANKAQVLEMACYLPGHYEAGMQFLIAVN